MTFLSLTIPRPEDHPRMSRSQFPPPPLSYSSGHGAIRTHSVTSVIHSPPVVLSPDSANSLYASPDSAHHPYYLAKSEPDDGASTGSSAAAGPSSTEPLKKKQKRNKPTLSCHECVERKTKVSLASPFRPVFLSAACVAIPHCVLTRRHPELLLGVRRQHYVVLMQDAVALEDTLPPPQSNCHPCHCIWKLSLGLRTMITTYPLLLIKEERNGCIVSSLLLSVHLNTACDVYEHLRINC